jgi:hypothetical protein
MEILRNVHEEKIAVKELDVQLSLLPSSL